MKRIANYIALALFAFGCNPKNSVEVIQEKNLIHSNNYLDYAKFIQENPNTDFFKEAHSKYLFLKDSIKPELICDLGCLEISPSVEDSIFISGYLFPLEKLRENCFKYLTFTKPWGEYSILRKHEFINPYNGDTSFYSSGRFDIVVYDNEFTYTELQSIVIEICKGIDDYKLHLSKQWYGKDYEQLNEEKKSTLNRIIGLRLKFFHFDKHFHWLPLPSKANQ